jgi:hypothetical protein
MRAPDHIGSRSWRLGFDAGGGPVLWRAPDGTDQGGLLACVVALWETGPAERAEILAVRPPVRCDACERDAAVVARLPGGLSEVWCGEHRRRGAGELPIEDYLAELAARYRVPSLSR